MRPDQSCYIKRFCFVTELNISRFCNDGLVSLFMSWQTSDISCLECVAITTMQLRFFQVSTHTCYSHYTESTSGEVRIINIIIPRITGTLSPKRCGKPLVVLSNFIHKSQYLRNLSVPALQFVNPTSYLNLIYLLMNGSFTQYGLISNEFMTP